jgi:hypothetical protein
MRPGLAGPGIRIAHPCHHRTHPPIKRLFRDALCDAWVLSAPSA